MLQFRPSVAAIFWKTAVISALALLAQVTAAADVPTCVWVEQLNFCTAAVKGAGGRRYIAVNAAAAACLANSDESGMQGCTHEVPVCRSVNFTESGLVMCQPTDAAFGTAHQFFRAFERFETCVGCNTTTCLEVRKRLYTALGCEDCARMHEASRGVATECYAASDEALCAAAATALRGGSGGNPGDFGMLGGFQFDDETLEDDLWSVAQVPGVLPPEEAAAAAAARSGAPPALPAATAALLAAAAAGLVATTLVL